MAQRVVFSILLLLSKHNPEFAILNKEVEVCGGGGGEGCGELWMNQG